MAINYQAKVLIFSSTDKKDIEEAFRLYQIAYDGFRKILGDHHYETLTAFFNLGVAAAELENY